MPMKIVSKARISITLNARLLRDVNRTARQTKQRSSSLIREALREHLVRSDVREQERRVREAYAKQPQTEEELSLCDAEMAGLLSNDSPLRRPSA